ncbi:hypothetical protein [Paraburkholderia sp. J10-1]|uniref:hypothetical protein n=1 Tax=Paraburkholderia sp. J10-1 TaxID=2805430 RepID=UPI002AB632A7|nr:hypothetical protein [Paraburkholderia sp. J10-1]
MKRGLVVATICGLLTGCGSGVNASLDGSTDEQYQKDINIAFAKMTPRQQRAFNHYAANMQISSIYAKYGTTTPKKLVEGEANGEIDAAQKVITSISSDFPQVAELDAALGKFVTSKPEIGYISGDDGQLLAEISFDVTNNSSRTFKCAAKGEDKNIFTAFQNMFTGDVPFKLDTTIYGKDGKGIHISNDSLYFEKDVYPNICDEIPSPGKSIRLTWKTSLGDLGGDLPTADHLKRVGVRELDVRMQKLALFPTDQKAVPQLVFAKYLDSVNTIVDAKQLIKSIQPED